MTLKEATKYEIANSPLAPYIWFKWGQKLAAQYYINKTKRKWKQYQKFLYNLENQKTLHQKQQTSSN